MAEYYSIVYMYHKKEKKFPNNSTLWPGCVSQCHPALGCELPVIVDSLWHLQLESLKHLYITSECVYRFSDR